MFEIKGKYASALCYASVIEEEAIGQIQQMCSQEFAKDTKICIMPDAHSGKGCTIGTTMTIKDKIVPNLVGVDIGCGMLVVNLGKVDIDLEKFDEVVHQIPSGMNVWDSCKEHFDLTKLRCYKHLEKPLYLEKSLGTLGGGNHFIEIDSSKDGTKYLIIHSGSRNLGKQAAEYYQNLAIERLSFKEELIVAKEQLIKRYRDAGRKKEIEKALIELTNEWKKRKPSVQEEFCYLSGQDLSDYLYDVSIIQKFALRNRELIAEIILKKMGLKSLSLFHTIHNYIDCKEMILRKGAISARKDEVVLIPINMRDGCVLAKGKGNPEWNYSAPHGAGRIMSRSKAKDTLLLEEYQEVMKGIYTTSVCQSTIDESPMAYKSLDDIIEAIADSVDIIEILKPIYNYKAS